MSQELISIVIPLYNKEENISRTIDSVLNLNYDNWELLIIDDGSTDNSASVVKSYIHDTRIKYFYKTNGGVSSARNLGIKISRGEWIIFLDADDYFLPNALSTLYGLVKRHNTLISTGNFFIKEKELEWKFCTGRVEKRISNNYRAWFYYNFFPRAGAALFHHTIIKKHLFDESLSRYEDAKSLFDIFRDNQIVYSPQPIMVYSLDNIGLSHKSNDINKDFIFNMDFEGKSFWEKIVLCELLIQGMQMYPEHKIVLKNKYTKSTSITIITKFLIRIRIVFKIFKSFL